MNINSIVDLLKDGKIIVMPTDTVYGISCDATNYDSVKKVFDIKKRSYKKPLVILVSNKDMLYRCIKGKSLMTEKIIGDYWPGPLTIVFDKSDYINDLVSGGTLEIAIRMPDNEFLLNIMNELDRPLVSTSANISGTSTIKEVSELEDEMKRSVDYIADGGFISNEASTIIRIKDEKVEIIRDGYLSDSIKKKYNC